LLKALWEIRRFGSSSLPNLWAQSGGCPDQPDPNNLRILHIPISERRAYFEGISLSVRTFDKESQIDPLDHLCVSQAAGAEPASHRSRMAVDARAMQRRVPSLPTMRGSTTGGDRPAGAPPLRLLFRGDRQVAL